MSVHAPNLTAAAVDLGAASGRTLLGHVSADRLETREVHRFPNEPVRMGGRLSWDVDALWAGTVAGLAEAFSAADELVSIGLDTWGVDYGLLDAQGQLVVSPAHYRDERTDGLVDRVSAELGAQWLYERTGLQFLPINTLYQLLAEDPAVWEKTECLLPIPDLLLYWLTGSIGAERTLASTTQLYDVSAGTWADDVLARLDLPRAVFPDIREPGTVLGSLQQQVRQSAGGDAPVCTVASHDTASAVAAVPATDDRFAYVSCGTWSLVGVELPAPVLTTEGRAANFANEIGVDRTVRYLRNVAGLWLLQESLRTWHEAGQPVELTDVLTAAEAEPARRSIVDVEDPVYLPPGDMPTRIRNACAESGQPVPASPAALVRCVLDSLALAHARNVRAAARLSGRAVDTVHIVGGGARNELLCQVTADACGIPVVAGPVEATALGNLLVQARARGVLRSREQARDLIRRTQQLRRYEPREHDLWAPYVDGEPAPRRTGEGE